MVIFLFEIFYVSENDRLIQFIVFIFNHLHICAQINKNSLSVVFRLTTLLCSCILELQKKILKFQMKKAFYIVK